MNASIERRPDGTFWIELEKGELENIKNLLNEGWALDDREITIAREFELI